eukprot:8649782-Pyramimonas_sp.AAC.2
MPNMPNMPNMIRSTVNPLRSKSQSPTDATSTILLSCGPGGPGGVLPAALPTQCGARHPSAIAHAAESRADGRAGDGGGGGTELLELPRGAILLHRHRRQRHECHPQGAHQSAHPYYKNKVGQYEYVV